MIPTEELNQRFRDTMVEYMKQKEAWLETCIHIYSLTPEQDKWNLLNGLDKETWVRVNPLIDPAFEYPEPWLTYLSYKGQAVAVLDEMSIKRFENTLGTMHLYVPDAYVKDCPIPIDRRATEEAWRAAIG